MEKTLILINGTMGAGKSATCQALYQSLDQSVVLDGDWCWMMHPWNFSEENKQMVMENIVFLLRNFLQNSSFRYVIFCWVLSEDQVAQRLLARLGDLDFRLVRATLTCSAEVLQSRLQQDGRSPEGIANSLARLPLYEGQDSVQIDNSEISVSEVAKKIRELVGAG